MTETVTLDDLRVHYKKHRSDAFGDSTMTAARTVTIDDLIQVLEGMGAKRVTARRDDAGFMFLPGSVEMDESSGSYLVLPLESK